MATTPENIDLDKVMLPNKQAQRFILNYAASVLTKRNQFTTLRNKFDAIDIAYARFKETSDGKTSDGVDRRAAEVSCDIFASDDVTPPIVVSQVDAYSAYLAEVFLSGSPLFPVVSNPSNVMNAEKLEAIIDDHATIGGYARQLLMFIRDACKYNFAAVETDWTSIDQFSVTDDLGSETASSIKRSPKKFTRLKRLNPRNVVWDYDVAPGDIAENGDYAGYIERVSKTKFKRLLNKWSIDRKALNVTEALASVGSSSQVTETNTYWEDPQISDYVSVNKNTGSPDWDAYFDGKPNRTNIMPGRGGSYELFTLYARIMPSEFGISAPQRNTPQIWKFVICNNQFVVYASRVISAYDYLPILFGQPLEDGLGYQTQSIAEGEIPFQQAARTLFNIRFAAARRAVSDRALYLPDAIKPSDINSKAAAPKIPVNLSVLSNKTISDVYHQIPFDMRGTETAIQDASLIVQFSKDLHGVNGPRMGSFQKGNKSVQEWNDTMGGSEGRMRLPALTLEYQVFSPLKSILSLNIFQYGEDGIVTSQKTGKQLEVVVAELRKANLSFKMADGFTPKSKLASTEVIMAGMNLIMNAPILQQAFGERLPSMFIHFMALSGAKGFEEYDPKYQAQPNQVMQQGLVTNNPAAASTIPEGSQPAP